MTDLLEIARNSRLSEYMDVRGVRTEELRGILAAFVVAVDESRSEESHRTASFHAGVDMSHVSLSALGTHTYIGEPFTVVPTGKKVHEECACPEHGSWIAADDVHRLVRQIDVALNGEAGAAKQAKLCDIAAQVSAEANKRGAPLLAAQEGYTTVPILIGFDHARPIGELRILTEHLPPRPDFVFAIGYSADSALPPGQIPTAPDDGPYRLVSASIATDEAYVKYLQQVGVAPQHVSAAPGGDVEKRARELLRQALGIHPDSVTASLLLDTSIPQLGVVNTDAALRAISAALSAPKQVERKDHESACRARMNESGVFASPQSVEAEGRESAYDGDGACGFCLLHVGHDPGCVGNLNEIPATPQPEQPAIDLERFRPAATCYLAFAQAGGNPSTIAEANRLLAIIAGAKAEQGEGTSNA